MSAQLIDMGSLRASAAIVARALLGKLLVVAGDDERCGGIIVETEAYLGRRDPACHLARGRTPRTEPFFRGAGTIYVYAIHQQVCLNVITGGEDEPECVLIRAVEPTVGIEPMRGRRGREEVHELASGPGKLCRALGITRADSGTRLGDGRIGIFETGAVLPTVGVTRRIGIRHAIEWPLRFVLQGNRHLSRSARDAVISTSPTADAAFDVDRWDAHA